MVENAVVQVLVLCNLALSEPDTDRAELKFGTFHNGVVEVLLSNI
jgi:hypothetical protein